MYQMNEINTNPDEKSLSHSFEGLSDRILKKIRIAFCFPRDEFDISFLGAMSWFKAIFEIILDLLTEKTSQKIPIRKDSNRSTITDRYNIFIPYLTGYRATLKIASDLTNKNIKIVKELRIICYSSCHTKWKR